ncbi:proclotting enzyme [Fopius arisanus]|uniref:Phenoloxidase-activating factor 2 n=1 Tax=Fopius arisanus TaxID=64838 RepID=A0A9R1TZ65_9HYME|nr:PREDICTED: proclotting enzyme [Fopius arisanus]
MRLQSWEMFTWRILSETICVVFYLVFVCFFVIVRANSEDNIINSRGLSSLEWGEHLVRGEKDPLLPENYTYVHLRGKRFVSLTNADRKVNKPHQACLAPGDKKGHCRHLAQCILKDFQTNFTRFLDYMCIIQQSYVGVCCPDSSKEVEQINSLASENLVGFLPAVADVDDKPIWGEASEPNETAIKSENGGDRQPRGPRGCGMSSKSKTRIVGGRPADPREWPWMVALIRTDADHYCGGVLITDRHVLTAAHCVHGLRKRDVIVRLGEYDFSADNKPRVHDLRIIEIRSHPDFDALNYDNDIAIIKLHRRTVFNTYIWPICLPPTGFSAENKSAIVTGWGTQYYGGPASPILLEVAVPVWPQDLCRRTMESRVSQNTLCAGAYQGGQDSCQGDSGGPLLHQLGNGRWINIGIVSWGVRCGEPGYPGIYTRVSSYLDWIFANAIF